MINISFIEIGYFKTLISITYWTKLKIIKQINWYINEIFHLWSNWNILPNWLSFGFVNTSETL